MRLRVFDSVGSVEALDTETWQLLKDKTIRILSDEAVAYLLLTDVTGMRGIKVNIDNTDYYVLGVQGGAFRLVKGQQYVLKGIWAVWGDFEVVA